VKKPGSKFVFQVHNLRRYMTERFSYQKNHSPVGLCKKSNRHSVDPQRLTGAWFQPLNLSSDILVSSLCFLMQRVPLQPGEGLEVLRQQLQRRAHHRERRGGAVQVVNAGDPARVNARDFNPCNYMK
jgi:hypothetical protein